jgi:membrane fusion protein (multidrug efflux system)
VQKAEASVAQARAQEAEATAASRQVTAQFATAQARTSQANAEVAQAKAQLDLAQLTLNRDDALFQDHGAVTQADLDNARSNFNAMKAAAAASEANVMAAQAGITAAQAAQTSAEAQITAAKANVAAAQAALRDAQRELADTKITAPTAGRIGNRNVETGNRVRAGQTLLALIEPEYWIVANFKETQLTRMHAGQPVEFTIDSLPGRTLHGTINSLSPASGAEFALLPPDNATGNFNKVVQRVPVKITIDSATQHEITDHLRLGLSVVVNVRVR